MARPSVVPQLTALLIHRLACGQWPDGSELPDLRTMAADFGVAKNTMRAALQSAGELNLFSISPRRRAEVVQGAQQRARDYLAAQTQPDNTRSLTIILRESKAYDNDPFYQSLIQELSGAARRRGIRPDMLRLSIRGQLDEIKQMRRQGPQAAVFVSMDSLFIPTLFWHVENRAPFMLFNRRIPGLEVPAVRIDEYQAATQLVKYLVSFGHRNICLIDNLRSAESYGTPNRSTGWLDALADQGLLENCTVPVLVLKGKLGMQRYCEGFTSLLTGPRRPTAVAFAGLPPAEDFASDPRLRHLRVPEDLSVVIFEPGEGRKVPHWPALTTVQIDLARTAECCMEVVEKLLAGDLNPPAIRVLEKMVIGESVGPAPPLAARE